MKKARLLAVSLACMLVCGATAACGDKNPDENGGSDSQNPAKEIWDEVAKLDFTNVTITSTGTGFSFRENENGESEKELVEYHETYKYDFGNKRLSYDYGSDSHCVCAEVDGVYYYFYRSGDGEWSKSVDKNGESYQFNAIIPFELGAFEDYTYDEETGKYVTTVIGKCPMSESAFFDKSKWKDYFVKREVKIEDGKLVEFYGEGNDGRTRRYVFSDYGTTVVNIPEV